jgi:wyosine [tRNA(Phe)-imidazoG37] synthetase (radical SAM superfamily)
MSRRLIYGPVPSRRFGLSLGIDLVPYKTCCYDCVYCQLGRTTDLSMERREFVPVGEVLAGVEESLASGPRPDVITFAGSGEPTLYARLGELIDGIRQLGDMPLLLLTNGGLLDQEEVLAEVMGVDILAPSLDAGDAETFRRINRPHADLSFEAVMSGVRRVARDYTGRLQLEIMLARGINDSNESVELIKKALEGIQLESVDLNTPVRPPADKSVAPCSQARLQEIQGLLGPKARIIADYQGRQAEPARDDPDERQIMEMISRRPCTIQDISSSLGIPPNLVIKVLDRAVSEKRVTRSSRAGQNFFFQPR